MRLLLFGICTRIFSPLHAVFVFQDLLAMLLVAFDFRPVAIVYAI